MSHGLLHEGAPYSADGTRLSRGWGVSTAGKGHARCSCGEVSAESYPSRTGRREWMRLHKKEKGR